MFLKTCYNSYVLNKGQDTRLSAFSFANNVNRVTPNFNLKFEFCTFNMLFVVFLEVGFDILFFVKVLHEV